MFLNDVIFQCKIINSVILSVITLLKILPRSDELTISGRTYSDASKAITCKYAFTDPTGALSANTVLKFRGKNWFLTFDNEPRSLQDIIFHKFPKSVFSHRA